ncbi:MAG: sulfite exporter TauE/SafE family protein [Armatimonadota bacterium]|nr:sulfite exporter TauE/SafE family protein [Armatimonadota bacterium]
MIASVWGAFIVGLAAGFAATPHCLGMCGGFPLQLARSSHRRLATLRQALFVIGKTFTYMFLGALASALGIVLLKDTSLAAAALRAAGGLITVVFGLSMVGVRIPSIGPLRRISDMGVVRGLFAPVLASPGPAAALTLGLGVGFLPCPLPLAMLAAAAASHNVTYGMALMAGVGLGTAPGLLAVGLFGVGLDRRFARFGMKAAGCIVIMIGLLTLGRVVVTAARPAAEGIPPCCSRAAP